jgi:membrane associated rhomboid family serine protease
MTPAAVGFRCPECMAEQRRGSGRARIVTRQQTRARWQSGLTGSRGLSVTKVLVAINAIVFVIEMIVGASDVTRGGGGASLADMGSLVPYLVVENGEYWRLFTSMFLHAGIFHLLMNMWALWVIGEYLESAVGRVRFVVIYFGAGLAGSALVVIASGPLTPTVGASGAIFGLFGALFVYSYFNRGRDLMASALLRSMGFIILINLAFTFMIPNISWQGHIGGLIGGATIMAGFTLLGRRDPRGRLEAIDGAVIVGAVVAVAAAVAYGVATFPSLLQM